MFIVIFSGGSQYSLANRHKLNSIVAAIGYSVDLDCQMNDPYVSVSLKQTKDKKDFDRIADGIKVTQSGQIFTINNVEKTDEGKYFCKVGPTSMRIAQVDAAKGITTG